MAEPQYVLSPEARDDLLSIRDFIADRDGPTIATAVVTRLVRTIGLVASLPGMGRLRSELVGSPRSFQVQSWTIFYRPSDLGITILRVLDSRRDIGALLGPRAD